MMPSDDQIRYDEKRKDIRHSCKKLADIFIGAQRYPGLIRNESKGGVFVETRGSFFTGDDVTVVYESPIGIDQKRTQNYSGKSILAKTPSPVNSYPTR